MAKKHELNAELQWLDECVFVVLWAAMDKSSKQEHMNDSQIYVMHYL